VWLVRHGSVAVQDCAYGDLDVHLSPKGEEETTRAAEALAALGPARVVASPLARARFMGEAVARRAARPLVLDERLREVHRGSWQGLPLAEYTRRWSAAAHDYWRDPLGWRGHDGESEAELRARVTDALEEHLGAPELSPSASGIAGVLVVAAHRQALRALVAALLGLPAAASHGLALDPSHAILVVDEPDGWTLARTNLPLAGAPHFAEPLDGPPEDVLMRPG